MLQQSVGFLQFPYLHLIEGLAETLGAPVTVGLMLGLAEIDGWMETVGLSVGGSVGVGVGPQ